ncbi:MAG TPA: FHA domain-containing protein, partial [Gemmataceae bacterium]|nr:FHA domain-containing protein [Gemmataceae bacterium]
MSFKTFIYYCAICGGWAAFLAWVLVQGLGIRDVEPPFLRVVLIGGLLGGLTAGAVGAVDAVLNETGGQRYVRVLLCTALGGVAGLLGGLIGQAFFFVTPYLLFIGWIIAGTLIGASIGAFDVFRALAAHQGMGAAGRKVLNGVYGGFLGGFVGGLFFGPLYMNEGAQRLFPHSSLAVALVVLGLCIGVLIGLAQVVLKEAWLKVEAGFRPGREVMLSKDETTIGRAESCDIGLFGDSALEKLHARIERKNNQYFLADAETAGGTYLNEKSVRQPTPLRNGDQIRVGACVLRFGERAK